MHDVSCGQKKNPFPGIGSFIGPVVGHGPVAVMFVPVEMFHETLLTMSAFDQIVSTPETKVVEKHLASFQVVCVTDKQVAWIPCRLGRCPPFMLPRIWIQKRIPKIPSHIACLCFPSFGRASLKTTLCIKSFKSLTCSSVRRRTQKAGATMQWCGMSFTRISISVHSQ